MTTLLPVQNALLDLVRSYGSGATFDSVNSSILDWTVLDAPDTEVAAVVVMAGDSAEGDSLSPFGTVRGSFGVQGKYQEVHAIGLWIYVKRGVGEDGEAAAAIACQTLTESMKDYIRPYEQWQTNGDPISRAYMTRTTVPGVYGAHGSSVGQMISFAVQCERDAVVIEAGF